MVAYADGALTAEELAAVRGVAAEIGTPISRPRRRASGAGYTKSKDYMLAQLARLPDAGSVAVVARELG
jgi:hypothetical protein